MGKTDATYEEVKAFLDQMQNWLYQNLLVTQTECLLHFFPFCRARYEIAIKKHD